MYTIPETITVPLAKAKTSADVAIGKMPDQSLAHIVSYGLRQILNDAMASAKTDAEADAAWRKRLDNLMAGTLRAAPSRTGDPVARRAKELAEAAVRAHPAFVAWAAKHSLKSSDKAFREKVAEQAAKALAKPDNAYVAQAKVDVAAANELGAIELDLG